MYTMITVVCPSCGNRMRASTEYIGRQGRCPACKELLEIRPRAAAGVDSAVTAQPASGAAPARVARSSTDVKAWLPGLIGAAATAFMYLAVFRPLRSTYFGALFVERGVVPYVTTLVFFWGLAMLALKYLAVKRQQSYTDLELEFIPLDIGLQIAPANVESFLAHLARLPTGLRGSILGRRIEGALDHFKSRNDVPEVQQYLSSQAEIDASGVDAGYTVLRAFIWCIPILGFIGTVLGISQAVTGLSGALEAGASAENLMSGLGVVTGGLATAFDTTFVALVFAILLLFPTEALRKTEYGMLDRIEAFTNESLLRRMSDERPMASVEDLPEVVRDVLRGAFQEHQRWLAEWQAQIKQLGQVIGADFEQYAAGVEQRLFQAQTQQWQEMNGTVQQLAQVFQRMGDATQSWHATDQAAEQRTAQLVTATQQLQPMLQEILEANRRLVEQQRNLLEQAASAPAQPYSGETDVLQPVKSVSDDGGAPRRVFGLFRRKKG